MATGTGREVCEAKECNINSWIPGRQCVLAKLPTRIGREQFHSSFYEALSKLQDCKDKPVKEKAALLVVIWKSLGACASSLNEVSSVFQFLFSETSLVILSREWADVNPVLKERLQTVIKECSQSLCQLVDEAARLCGVLTMALHDPWGESLLRELLTSSEDNNCFTKDGMQPEGLLLKRIEQLSAVGCEDAALQLCKICLQCHQNSCETRSFVNATCYGPETSEQEIEGTFMDWLLRLLHRTGRLTELVRETMKYTCHDGVRLIRRVQQSSEPDALDLAEVLTNSFLVGDLLQTSTYCCTKELMVLWCDIQVEKDRELEEVFNAVKMLLVCYAATSAHFYLFVDILWEKYGPSLFPLYVELYVRGLTSDLNYLEAINIKGRTDEVKELQVHISSVYYKFGTLFASRWPVIAYECVLSSFSLDPNDDKIGALYKLHKIIYGQQEHTKVNDILHLTHSSGGCVTSVPQIECRCGGRCSTPSEEPEILASLCHDGRPPYIYKYSHPILDTHIPGVSFSLLKDLVVVLECLRCQFLKAKKCWKEVESLCNWYIANNSGLNIAMQCSSSFGNEVDLVSDHRVCLPAVVEECYLNRTKENYYYYTQNEVNAPLSCASSFPSDVCRSLFIQKGTSSGINKTLYSVITVPSSKSKALPSATYSYNTNLSIPCEKNTSIMNLPLSFENDVPTRNNSDSLDLNILSPIASTISPCTNSVTSDVNISLNKTSSPSFSINTVPLHAKNIFQVIDTTLSSGSNEFSTDMKSSYSVTPCTKTFVPSTHPMSSTICNKTTLSCQNNLTSSISTTLPFSCESTVSSNSGTDVCCKSGMFTVNNVENKIISTTVAGNTEDSLCGISKKQESETVNRRKTMLLSEYEKESHYLSEVPHVTSDSFETSHISSEVILPRVKVTTAEPVKPTNTQTVKVVLSRLNLGSVKSIYIPKVVDNSEKTSASKAKSVVKKPVVVLSDILSPNFLSDPNTTNFVQQALVKHHGTERKRKCSDADTGQSTKKLKVTVIKLMTPEDTEFYNLEKYVTKTFRKGFQSIHDHSLGSSVNTSSLDGEKMNVQLQKETSYSPVSSRNLEFSSLDSNPCVTQEKPHETRQSQDNSLGSSVNMSFVDGGKMCAHLQKETSLSSISPMNLEISSLASKPFVAQGKSHETRQSRDNSLGSSVNMSSVDGGKMCLHLQKETSLSSISPMNLESSSLASKPFVAQGKSHETRQSRDNSLGSSVNMSSVDGGKMCLHFQKETSLSSISPMNLEFSSLASKPFVAQGKSRETEQSQVSVDISSPGENSSIIQCKKIIDSFPSNFSTVLPSTEDSVKFFYGTVNSPSLIEKELIQDYIHGVDKKASDHRGRIKNTNTNLPQIIETCGISDDRCTINSMDQESFDESQRLNIREVNENAQNMLVKDVASGMQLQTSHNWSLSFVSSFEKFIKTEEERRKTLDCKKSLEPSAFLSKELLDAHIARQKTSISKESFQILSCIDQEISRINSGRNENIKSANFSENCLSSVEFKKSSIIVKENDTAKQCSHHSGNERKCSILDDSESLQFVTSCSADDKSKCSSSLLSSFYAKQEKNPSTSYSYEIFNNSNSVNVIPEDFTCKLIDSFESSPDDKDIEKMDIRSVKAITCTSMSSDSEITRNFIDKTIELQRDEADNVDKNNIFNLVICSSTENMSNIPELQDCHNSIPNSSASKACLLVEKCTYQSKNKCSLKEDKQLIGDSGSEGEAYFSHLYSLTLNDKLHSRALYSNVMLHHKTDKTVKNSEVEVTSTLVSQGSMCTTSLTPTLLEEEDCKTEMLLSKTTKTPILPVVTSEGKSSLMDKKVHRIPIFLVNRPFLGTAKENVLGVSKVTVCNSYLTKPAVETFACSAFTSIGESKIFETRSIKPQYQKNRTDASDGEIRFGAKLVNRAGKEIAGKLVIPVSNISNPALKTLFSSTIFKSGVFKSYSSLGDSIKSTEVSVMNSKPLMSVHSETKGRDPKRTQNSKRPVHLIKMQNTPVMNSVPFQSINCGSPTSLMLKDGDSIQLGEITSPKSILIPSVKSTHGTLETSCNSTTITVNPVSVGDSSETINLFCKVSRGIVNPSPLIQAIPEAVDFDISFENKLETADTFSNFELITGRINSISSAKMAPKPVDLVPFVDNAIETVNSPHSVKDSLKTRSTLSSEMTSEMMNYISSVKVTSKAVNPTPSNSVTPKTVNFTPSVKMQWTKSSTPNVQLTPGTLNFTPIHMTAKMGNFIPPLRMTNIKVNSACYMETNTKTVNSISSVKVTPGILTSTSSIPVTPGKIISTPLVQMNRIIGNPVCADHIAPEMKTSTPTVCIAPRSVNSVVHAQMPSVTVNSTPTVHVEPEIVNSTTCIHMPSVTINSVSFAQMSSKTLNSNQSMLVIPSTGNSSTSFLMQNTLQLINSTSVDVTPGTMNTVSLIHATTKSVDGIPLVQMKRISESLIPAIKVTPRMVNYTPFVEVIPNTLNSTHFIHMAPRTIDATSVHRATGSVNISHSVQVTLKQAESIIPPETTLKYTISSLQEHSQTSSIYSHELIQRTSSVTLAVENSVKGINCTHSSKMTLKPLRSNISNECKLDMRKFIHPVEKVPENISSALCDVESTKRVKSPCVLRLAVGTSELNLSHEATVSSNSSAKKLFEMVNGEKRPKTPNMTSVDEVSISGGVISAPHVQKTLRTGKALSFAGIIPNTFNSTILKEFRPIIHLKPSKEISTVPCKQPLSVIKTANVTPSVLTATSNKFVSSDIKTTASVSKSTPNVGLKTMVSKRKPSGEMAELTLNKNSPTNNNLKYNKSSVSFLSVTATRSSSACAIHDRSVGAENTRSSERMEKKRGWIPVRNAPGVMEYRKAPHHRQFSVGSAQKSDVVGKVNTHPQKKLPCYVHTSGVSHVTSVKSVSGQTLLNSMQTQSNSSLLPQNNQNIFNQKIRGTGKTENRSKSTKGTIILLREDVVRDSRNSFQNFLQEQKSSSAEKICLQKFSSVQKNSVKSNECLYSELPCLHSASHCALNMSIDSELKESNLELLTAEVTKIKTIPTILRNTGSLLNTETYLNSSHQQVRESTSNCEKEFQPLSEQKSKDSSLSATKLQRKVNTAENSELQVKSHGMKRLMDTREAVKCMRYAHASKSTGDTLTTDFHDS